MAVDVGKRAKVVQLKGGPMDRYLVTPDAPALDPEWYRTWPRSVRRKNEPGRYELVDGKNDVAEWRELHDS